MAQLAARVYASSFFELMEEEEKTREALQELSDLKELLEKFPDYLKFLSSPLINLSERLEKLDELLGGKILPLTLHFLKLLVQKGRILLFPEIVSEYQKLWDEKNNIERAEVITAIPLNDVLSQKLIQKLEQVTGKTVQASYRVDPAILGGVVVKFENEQFDSSVRSRLDTLKKQLTQMIV